VNLNETLSILVGWVGQHLDVTIYPAREPRNIIAGFGGVFERAEDAIPVELRAKWDEPDEALMFRLGGTTIFFIDPEFFEEATWHRWDAGKRRALEIRFREIALLVEHWESAQE
jgi:hypothetical protein